jgi:non-specific serine/threonine protein kinase
MSPDVQRPSLPLSLSSFFGRQRELALIATTLESSRLVTLTGPGGIGKTRLAIEAARAWTDSQPADAVFLDLSSATDALTMGRAVAAALDILEDGKASLDDQVLRYLRQGSELIIFDNCEHVIEVAATYVDRVLRNCPAIRVLCTSREPLIVDGEIVLAVPPLDLDLEALPLFEARARAIAPEFAEGASPADMRRICAQLDGLPLAIELAAARTRALSLPEINARLGDRFALLSAGSRSAPERHRTLEAALDWSYNLLTAKEASLYQRLSVFADGFTVLAAEAACAGEGIAPAEVVSLLSNLVDRSLVQHDVANPGRYRLLETMRQHAASKLTDREAWARRHFDWMLGLALEAEPEFRGPGKVRWLDIFSGERANIRAALRWAENRPELAEERLRLVTALVPLWWFRGPLSEGEGWLRSLLDAEAETTSTAVVRARLGLGTLRHSAGDLPGAEAELERAVREARDGGFEELLAEARVWLAGVLAFQGESGAAGSLLEQARPVIEAKGQDYDLARLALGCIWAWPGIQRDWQADLAIVRRAGDPSVLAAYLTSLGEIARTEGDLAAARRCYEESVASQEPLGGRAGGRAVASWLNLALIALMEDDAASALPYLKVAMRNAVDVQTIFGISGALVGASLMAAVRRQPALAARLLGGALALNRTAGAQVSAADAVVEARVRSLAAGALGQAGFETEFAAGELAELEVTISEAVDLIEREARDHELSATAPSPRPGGLSRQEAEVVRLLAAGNTNREIAAHLVLSVRTVEHHVASAYTKANVRGRAEATAWAIAHGLGTVPEPGRTA